MAGRLLPGVGLKADWALGEDNWKDENDTNMRLLSLLLAGVQTIESATPGAPAEGARHLFDADHPTEPNNLALYDEATWYFFDPVEGMEVFNADDGVKYRFVDGGWSAIMLQITQAEYDALVTKDPNTLYLVTV